jgi:chemotaxis protein methyltransferase CheR
VTGSDISTRVLQQARRGHYPDERARLIPPDYLRRFCLKGTGQQQGTMLVERSLRSRVEFLQANLMQPPPPLEAFDVIFLRNVMIYFNDDTKRRVVRNIVSRLKPGGALLVGHSETLNGISDAVRQLNPAIYTTR